MACAVLAAEDANTGRRRADLPLDLVPIDAGRRPDAVANDVASLVAARAIDTLVGFHTSDVHRRLDATVGGRLPYVFTPPHEGGPRSAGVVLLGEGPAEQLRPVIERLASGTRLRRWALIGNDYIWPRAVHASAGTLLHRAGGDVVLQRMVPFGAVAAERLIRDLVRARVDAVLLSLVGRDLATFNRAFARSAGTRQIVRVSGSLDETGLLEADGDSTGELYAAMHWFATDRQSEEFQDRYRQRWGPTAPTVSVYAQGCYEGVQLVSHLAHAGALTPASATRAAAQLRPRRAGVRLARAEGLDLVALR
jgi:ABC-type branched-subunit amino acid transport system substrate-binding protein